MCICVEESRVDEHLHGVDIVAMFGRLRLARLAFGTRKGKEFSVRGVPMQSRNSGLENMEFVCGMVFGKAIPVKVWKYLARCLA